MITNYLKYENKEKKGNARTYKTYSKMGLDI